MPKFRKKPVEVEAEQYIPPHQIPAGVSCYQDVLSTKAGDVKYVASVITPNGMVHITPGEWIITGVSGERYPCQPDIFEKTYDPVDDGPGFPERTAGFRSFKSFSGIPDTPTIDNGRKNA